MDSRQRDMSATTALAPQEVAFTEAGARETGFLTARRLLRLDGVFEAVLGVTLALSPLTGLSAALKLPFPAHDPVVVAFGLLLIPVLPVLWIASGAPSRRMVMALAAGNGAGALVFALWVAALHDTFNAAGTTFVLGMAGSLAALAALQADAARQLGSG